MHIHTSARCALLWSLEAQGYWYLATCQRYSGVPSRSCIVSALYPMHHTFQKMALNVAVQLVQLAKHRDESSLRQRDVPYPGLHGLGQAELHQGARPNSSSTSAMSWSEPMFFTFWDSGHCLDWETEHLQSQSQSQSHSALKAAEVQLWLKCSLKIT